MPTRFRGDVDGRRYRSAYFDTSASPGSADPPQIGKYYFHAFVAETQPHRICGLPGHHDVRYQLAQRGPEDREFNLDLYASTVLRVIDRLG